MENELMNLNENVLALVIENPYEDELKDILISRAWLPRVQFCSANSDLVKSEKIGMNHYALITGIDQTDDLGREVDLLLITIRPRALDTSDKNNIRASSVKNSELYKDIKDTADNTEGKTGCLYGPEFLVYIPQKKVFATLLFGNKTSRNEAGKVEALMYNETTKQRQITPATFKSKPIKNTEYTWYGMMAIKCSTPFELPSIEDINNATEIFLNPKEIDGREKVKVEQSSKRVR